MTFLKPVFLLFALVSVVFFLLGLKSQKGSAPGLKDGKLSPLSSKPNCVSSEDGTQPEKAVEPLDAGLAQAKAARTGLEVDMGYLDIKAPMDGVVTRRMVDVGDMAALAPSVWIIWKAKEMGATRGALAYMIMNTTVDFVVGSIPIAGDIFDMVYNANIRNVAALERNLNKTAHAAKEVHAKPQMIEIT